jgi:hypothetical protein
MQSKGISLWVYELPGKIRENKAPVFITYSDLFKEFNLEINNVNEEMIRRVVDWLEENNLETEPNIEFAPTNANLRIQEKNSDTAEFDKLPLSSLPCAHIGREKLPIIINNDFKLNLVADEIIKKKENAFLILEDINHGPIGIIDTYSFAKFIKLKDELCDISQIVRPIYICAKSTDSLIAVIDDMIDKEKPYLIITDEHNVITGFSSLNGLLKEYYPLTKPYLILSKIENLVNDTLRLQGCNEIDYQRIINEPQKERLEKKFNGRLPIVSDLTVGQKFDILKKKGKQMRLKFGENHSTYLGYIEAKLVEFLNIRNKYCHFSNALHFNNEDLLYLNEFYTLLQKYILILIQKPKQQ